MLASARIRSIGADCERPHTIAVTAPKNDPPAAATGSAPRVCTSLIARYGTMRALSGGPTGGQPIRGA